MNSTQRSSIVEYYDYLFTELADPRTNDWFLISSPIPGLTILALYLYFTLNLGPRLMRDRKPFDLKRVLIVYNIFQVVACVWLFYEALAAAWGTTYSWKCEPVDPSNSPQALRVARGVYAYFLVKMIDLCDTIFFVLRKKEKNLSFLHMYHHTGMPMAAWGCTKYYPGGHQTFIGLINTFVHIVMYTYYCLAAVGPKMRPYLWWKRYITRMQMGQFCLAFVHSSQLLWNDCGYPKFTLWFTMPNAVFFYFLFNDFYKKEYRTGGGDGGVDGERNDQRPVIDGKGGQFSSGLTTNARMSKKER